MAAIFNLEMKKVDMSPWRAKFALITSLSATMSPANKVVLLNWMNR